MFKVLNEVCHRLSQAKVSFPQCEGHGSCHRQLKHFTCIQFHRQLKHFTCIQFPPFSHTLCCRSTTGSYTKL